jgi:murein DD-endopeptidase MepM/ murein hydrolase activator NlpD
MREIYMRLPVIRTFVRGQDRWGSGEFQAPRGDRVHNGIDIVTPPGSEVLAVSAGKVTKIGFPYSQAEPELGFKTENERKRWQLKAALRYVQVSTKTGQDVRYFYVDPDVRVGDQVAVGRTLGFVQDLQPIYQGITDHYHFEVKWDGNYVNPYAYLEDVL